MRDIDEAERYLAEQGFDYVRFEQPDLHGMSRGKTVPARHFRHYAEQGLNFLGGLLGLDLQGRVASGTGYLEERNFADSLVFPDLSTLAPVPWAERTARVLADPPPTTRVAYLDEAATMLPRTLDEALAAFEADQALRDHLGEEFVHLFLAVKHHEIARARAGIPDYDRPEWPDVVTPWERQNLFEYL